MDFGECCWTSTISDTVHPYRPAFGSDVPVPTRRLESVSLLLHSTAPSDETLTLKLHRLKRVWHLRPSLGIEIATARITAVDKGCVLFLKQQPTQSPRSAPFNEAKLAEECRSWRAQGDVKSSVQLQVIASSRLRLA